MPLRLRRSGFPILLKPSAGGGGIGMESRRRAGEMADAVQRARREAEAGVRRRNLYVEGWSNFPGTSRFRCSPTRTVTRPLFERECSVQRRHQKVIEESPGPS